jgi:16S rRNA (adenine1518-N6/adenine1519-N6)-dimethyltransferase
MSENPTSLRVIRALLAGKGIAPRKSLGQNFLIDQNILAKIMQAGAIGPGDWVVEIGPGLGALTQNLLEAGAKVTGIEYDGALTAILKERLAEYANFDLINQDFLQSNLSALLGRKNSKFHYKVMANLPYYITTPAIFQCIESPIAWQVMVFLVQKEVGMRICAQPGSKEYGALTVMLNYHGQVDYVATVPRTVFYPSPKVDSALIRIKPRGSATVALYPYLHRIVQTSFGQRRKTILNALSANAALFGPKDEAERVLRSVEIDPQRRGETLTGAEFVRLASILRAKSK